MKTTLPLSWQAIVSKIHPPLPMTPRESQRLLTLLNASFKHQLDQEHPAGLGEDEHYADLHMKSILTSPFFHPTPSKNRIRLENNHRNDRIHFGGLQHLMKEPMDAFQERISAGTATLETAKLCLEIQLKQCLTSADVNSNQSMRRANTASPMLHWLWSSGLEESGNFLQDRKFTRLLVAFLVSEQRHDRIITWLRRLRIERKEDTPMQVRNIPTTEAYLLLQTVKSECIYGQGFDSAVKFFVKTFQELPSRGFEEAGRIFSPAGHYLTFALSGTSKTKNLANSTLESFVKTTTAWAKPSSIAFAWQRVYHPESSNPTIALQYLQKLSVERLRDMNPRSRLRIVLMCLRVSELFLTLEKQVEAIWVMKFLQSKFSREIGLQVAKETETQPAEVKREDEETNLRLLETLAVH